MGLGTDRHRQVRGVGSESYAPTCVQVGSETQAKGRRSAIPQVVVVVVVSDSYYYSYATMEWAQKTEAILQAAKTCGLRSA